MSNTAQPVTGLKRLQLSQTNRPIDVVTHWNNKNELLLDTPYQRGDVWGTTRRRNLIRSILLGIPIPSITINDRWAAGWGKGEYAVIDGKQRLTTILRFLSDRLDVPGEWFGIPDRKHVLFSELDIVQQRRFRNHAIPFTEGQFRSLEEEQEVYELINYGGVPQGESD